MKRICVFFFSGTGMTKLVVEKLKDEFENNQICFDCFQIEKVKVQDIQLNSYDMVGVAYPVHSFNAPQLVINFVMQLPPSESMNTFIINTAGEHSALNFASSALLMKLLRKRGYNAFYDKSFTMPCNFIVHNDETTVKHRLSDLDKEIPKVFTEIMNGIPIKQASSFLVRALAVIGRIEWLGAHVIGKFFYNKKSCNLCGKCVQICPNRNIQINKNAVHFKWHCGLCMRCLYQCPQKAIHVHIPFRLIRLNS